MAKLRLKQYSSKFSGPVGWLSFYLAFLYAGIAFAQSKTIVDEWASVQPPKPPELKAVKIEDPKSTAFLVLDMVKQACNNELSCLKPGARECRLSIDIHRHRHRPIFFLNWPRSPVNLQCGRRRTNSSARTWKKFLRTRASKP